MKKNCILQFLKRDFNKWKKKAHYHSLWINIINSYSKVIRAQKYSSELVILKKEKQHKNIDNWIQITLELIKNSHTQNMNKVFKDFLKRDFGKEMF